MFKRCVIVLDILRIKVFDVLYIRAVKSYYMQGVYKRFAHGIYEIVGIYGFCVKMNIQFCFGVSLAHSRILYCQCFLEQLI